MNKLKKNGYLASNVCSAQLAKMAKNYTGA
jgi:hypothetical protein